MTTNEYWKTKDQEYRKKWAKRMSASPINWISRSNFWKVYNKNYQEHGRYLNKELEFSISLEDLRARILEPPVFTPLEEDFPGPVERWYGKVENHLFILTHYYHPEYQHMTAVYLEDRKDVVEIVMKALNDFKALKVYG
jgi:hypothetical protein